MIKSIEPKGLVCSCFLSKNYFVKKFNIHLDYPEVDEKENFIKKLKSLGATQFEILDIFQALKTEHLRRSTIGKKSSERKEIIQKHYKPLHPEIFIAKKEMFHSKFLNVVEIAKSVKDSNEVLKNLSLTSAEQVYTFPIFTQSTCDKFVSELNNFEKSGLPKGKVNTMNDHGILLNELGFNDFMNELRTHYISPIANLLFPQWTGSSGLDSQKAFTVQYKPGEDEGLDCHYDNAEITLNISLDDDFDGCSLFFGKMRMEDPVSLMNTKEVKHRKGWGLLHRGQQLHGALPIEFGERHNLIIWMRSSSIRNQLCPMCDQLPDVVETEGDGDGFTLL